MEDRPPPLWSDIKENHASIEDCQLLITKPIKVVALDLVIEINSFYLTDQMVKEIIGLMMAPGGLVPVWKMFQ